MSIEEWLDLFVESIPNKYALKIGLKEMKTNEKWINFILNHDDKEWSKIQNKIINNGLKAAQSIDLTVEEYLKFRDDF
jgi:hypothetical protein